MKNNCYEFVNLPLDYPYNALEPYIDEKTMCLHHSRHLQTYIDNLNALLKNESGLKQLPLERLIMYSSRFCCNPYIDICRNAGGVYNHRVFFSTLKCGTSPDQNTALYKDICKTFGSLDNFKAEFKKAALSLFGSGYAWLLKDNGGMCISTTANQQTPLLCRYKPIFNIDVWEHAYYLKHYNLRKDYIDDWFKVLDWEKAQENYMCS